MYPAPAVAPAEVSARLKQRGVLMNAINDRCVRAVTHYDVDRAAVRAGGGSRRRKPWRHEHCRR